MSVALPTTTAKVVFCPECGSPSIETGTGVILASDPGKIGSSCKACGWKGMVSDLAATTLQHTFGSDEELTKALVGDLRVLLAKEGAVLFGKFLMKWGFLDVQQTPKGSVINTRQLSRYIVAIGRATLTAIVEERQKIETEKQNGS